MLQVVPHLMVTTQEPVPLHAPLQPEKVEPVAGVGVNVTTVPWAKFALQVIPQLMPAGELATKPAPVPIMLTLSMNIVGGAMELKVAVTLAAAFIVTVHEPVPLQAPLQPARVDPLLAVGVSVTTVPDANGAEHVGAQLMPAGELVTDPVPVPALLTDSVKVVGGGGLVAAVKVAVMASAEFTVSGHVPVPVHAPLQPANVDPGSGVGMSVICLPYARFMLQVVLHTNPDGDDVTTPVPVPVLVTVIEGAPDPLTLNVAATLIAEFIVTLQEPVPLQAPLQPAKVDPLSAVGVSVTIVD